MTKVGITLESASHGSITVEWDRDTETGSGQIARVVQWAWRVGNKSQAPTRLAMAEALFSRRYPAAKVHASKLDLSLRYYRKDEEPDVPIDPALATGCEGCE